MRRIVVTGVVALATVLGTWGAVSAASAGTSSPASVSVATSAVPPVSTSAATPGSFPAAHRISYPAGVRPAVTTPDNVLEDVSCFNPKDCLAVGANWTANGGHGSPISYLWNGSSWRAAAVHLPSGTTGGYLASVSCKPGLCVAVGQYWRGAATYPFAQYWRGAGWTATPQPAAISGAKYTYLAIISCYSATFCVASGAYTPTSNTNLSIAIAEVWNGGSWRLSKPPAAGPYHYAGLYSVSCPAANFCLLGGQYATSVQDGNGGGYFDTLVERFDGAHWAQVGDAVPTPAQGYASFINGVSCSSSASCAVVGEDINIGTTTWHAFAETLGGGAWTLGSVPFPASPASQLDAVSCPTATYCLAVGGLGAYAKSTTGRAAYAVWTGSSSWAIHYLATSAGQGGALVGVQCLTATSCDAAGVVGTYNTNSGHGLTGFWNGTAWTLVNTA